MTNRIRLMKATLLVALMLAPLSAFSHAKLNTPTPRSADTGDTNGPCGGKTAGTPVQTFVGGSTATVQFEVTIQHPGPFYLSLSTTGDNGPYTQIGTWPERQTTDPTPQAPDVYNETVTIPNTPCTNCVLQLKQFNTNEYYYSCADVTITAGTSPTPTPTPSASASATPTPTPTATATTGSGSGGSNSTQSLGNSNSSNTGAQMGSCGSVHDSKGGPGQGPGAALMIFLPLALMVLLRKRVRVRA